VQLAYDVSAEVYDDDDDDRLLTTSDSEFVHLMTVIKPDYIGRH